MILLILGAMQTLGRQREVQHRGFLELCEREGWLDVFSRPTEELDDWMLVLEEYLDQGVHDNPYLQWMGRFASIFQFAHWLPAYVDAFLAINQFERDFELSEITAPRASASFQGSGLDAPPVTRNLGIGACFVVRELARSGMIRNSKAYRHCFVPSARVRRLMQIMGCPGLDYAPRSAAERVVASRIINDYLGQILGSDDALFHGDFDLPLIVLTDPANRDLLSDLLEDSRVDEVDLDDDATLEVF